MQYVYLLKNQSNPPHHYTGLTTDLKSRLAKHNEGGVPSTAQHKPWTLQTYIAFTDQAQAAQFERYLKSGSGRAFAQKRLWS